MSHAELTGLNLTFVSSSLGCGGAEGVMAGMCNEWSNRGVNVSLVTLRQDISDHYSLAPNVKRSRVEFFWPSKNLFHRAWSQIKRWVRLRRAIQRTHPDVVIVFIDKTNIRVLLAMLGSKIPIIVSERCDPRMYQLGKTWGWLRKQLYPKAAAVVAQSESVATWLTGQAHASRVEVIPNGVRDPSTEIADETRSARQVIAMGRLCEEKGFDLLLQAWSKCRARETWRLRIMGDGDLYESLEASIRTLGLSDSVSLEGKVDRPNPMLAQSQIFVMSSRTEGFPNALLEAMACGVPAISFDCPSGPANIIRHGVDGLLVENGNVDALAAALDRLIDDPTTRRQMSESAREVVERFSTQSVLARWEALILSNR